jgi:3-oxoacyl-[acyl-carrier-protein] synthase-3
MKAANLKKGILVCGDTPSKAVNKKDKTSALLFGDAVAATLIEQGDFGQEMIFSLGSDGSGYETIMIPEGGFRNPYNKNTLDEIEVEPGIFRQKNQLQLNGMDVFAFGITQVPKAIKEIYQFANLGNDSIDFAIFHQANKMMNEMIRKKLKLEAEKVPYSLQHFGNTSSASIPITMLTQLKTQLETKKLKFLLCGFGVGLSWASCILDTDNIYVTDLIEI